MQGTIKQSKRSIPLSYKITTFFVPPLATISFAIDSPRVCNPEVACVIKPNQSWEETISLAFTCPPVMVHTVVAPSGIRTTCKKKHVAIEPGL